MQSGQESLHPTARPTIKIASAPLNRGTVATNATSMFRLPSPCRAPTVSSDLSLDRQNHRWQEGRPEGTFLHGTGR